MTLPGVFVLMGYMTDPASMQNLRHVIIASANPLFGKGLLRLFEGHWKHMSREIMLTTSLAETITKIESFQPDLVIIDCDDEQISRTEFLNYFVSQAQPMQVMLVSLKDTGAVMVYDRKMMTSNQIDEWLSNT